MSLLPSVVAARWLRQLLIPLRPSGLCFQHFSFLADWLTSRPQGDVLKAEAKPERAD